MDFLVKVDASAAYTLSAAEREVLIADERRVGRELLDRGVIRGFWRIPGTRANIGVWRAKDADELERILDTLPIRPHAEIQVTALATHPMVADHQAPLA